MAVTIRYQLRLGMVLYGGASLAIYMNGMTQEVLALLRAAHARRLSQMGRERPWVQTQRLSNPYWRLLEAAEADVEVDVISGTSAGGLNGLMLAKALAVGAPDLDGLTRLWQEVAQIHRLAMYDKDPISVLSGDFLYDELRKVMEDLTRNGDPELAEQVRVLDLFVTGTDIRGHRWTRRDRLHQKVQGIAHRYLFHLKKRTVHSSGRGYAQNDFLADPARGDEETQTRQDGLLAKIGRATSAFPAVFPPIKISRAEAKAASVGIMTDLDEEYKGGIWFSDGGILANKPFEPVLETIFNRSAELPVRRVLAYLEPDPQEAAYREQTEPNMVETALAAATLPMNQDIKEQLDRLLLENQRRRQLKLFMTGLGEGLDQSMGAGTESEVADGAGEMAAEAVPSPRFQMRALQQALAEAAPTQMPVLNAAPGAPQPDLQAYNSMMKTYFHLRLNRLQDVLRGALDQALERMQVKELAARTTAIDALVSIIPVWNGEAGDPAHAHDFLQTYDAEYNARRLHFMLSRVQDHYRPGNAPADEVAMKQALRRLWGALEDWQNARWVVANSGGLGAGADLSAAQAAQLNDAMKRWAEAIGRGQGSARLELDQVIAALGHYLQAVRKRADADERLALQEMAAALPLTRRDGAKLPLDAASLCRISENFEPIDMMLFPLQTYAQGDDWQEVQLYRLSPGAADGWVTKSTREKLAGESVGHFGAFLDERWRSNDIMWGRLDGAELLFRMLVQQSDLVPGNAQPAESEYPAAVSEALAMRRRQILASFPELIDLRELQGMTNLQQPAREKPRLPVGQRLMRAFDLVATGQMAAASMSATGPDPVFELKDVPDAVLQKYLRDRYRVGAEGVDSLPSERLAGEIILILHNTIHALRKPAPAGLGRTLQKVMVLGLTPLSWIARLILIPRKGLFGVIQGNLAPLLTIIAVTLLALQLVGAIRLNSGGWAAVIALITPVALDSLFRPSFLRVAVTGLLALTAGAGALVQGLATVPDNSWLTALAPVGAALEPLFARAPWLLPLQRIWLFTAGLFGAVTLSYSFHRRWLARPSRSGEKPPTAAPKA